MPGRSCLGPYGPMDPGPWAQAQTMVRAGGGTFFGGQFAVNFRGQFKVNFEGLLWGLFLMVFGGQITRLGEATGNQSFRVGYVASKHVTNMFVWLKHRSCYISLVLLHLTIVDHRRPSRSDPCIPLHCSAPFCTMQLHTAFNTFHITPFPIPIKSIHQYPNIFQ